jgi:hypothetical protein
VKRSGGLSETLRVELGDVHDAIRVALDAGGKFSKTPTSLLFGPPTN